MNVHQHAPNKLSKQLPSDLQQKKTENKIAIRWHQTTRVYLSPFIQ